VGTSHAAAATATPQYAATTAATATERTAATLSRAVGARLAEALRRVAASLRRHPVGAVARLLADTPVLSIPLVGAGGVFETVRGGGGLRRRHRCGGWGHVPPAWVELVPLATKSGRVRGGRGLVSGPRRTTGTRAGGRQAPDSCRKRRAEVMESYLKITKRKVKTCHKIW